MGWLSGWTHRKSITLSRTSGAVTNYQMKLLVGESSGATGEDVDCGALCQTDFDDIRFTTSDGTTLLDYWIESITGTTPNQLATIWIEFDSIGTDATTFYMYFGNAGATAYSNGANTFLKFDHFDNSSFDTGLWSKTEAKALTVTESGTALTVGGTINATGGFTDCYARSVFTYAQNYAVGARIKLTGSGTGYGAELRLQKDTSNNTFVGPRLWSVPTLNYLMEYKSSDDGTFYVLDETDLDSAYHRYEITYVRSTGVEKFYEDSVYKGTDTVAGLANVTTYIELSCIARVANDVTTAMFDWVYVRNFEATEPAWGSWGPQETLLTIADAAHALSSENIALVEHKTLAIADAAHALSSDNITLDVGMAILIVANAIHALSSENIAI